ncbi:MAG: stage 0 sporulation family protein [Dehalococcoidia bacterium]|nr:stage 0 sporulation family protein [Dehalococcoidia bacterium]
MTEQERPPEGDVFDECFTDLPPLEDFEVADGVSGVPPAEPKPMEIRPDEPKDVVGVRFQRAGRVYYFAPGDLELRVNDQVVAETERGPKLGRVVIAPRQVMASQLTEPLKPVLRLATPEDLGKLEALRAREREAQSKCAELSTKLNLPIKVLAAESSLDGSHVTIFFSAEGRVDFRQLVRELAGALRARVELRQVGPRDEAKLMGGMGRCGFTLCCASFLTEFNPLSIKTAKEQGLSLEPAKISGTCGRLLCCLGYEAEFYRSMKGKLPGMGKHVVTPLGEGVVVGVNAIKETVMVQMESQAAVEFPAGKVTLKPPAEPPKKGQQKPRKR